LSAGSPWPEPLAPNLRAEPAGGLWRCLGMIALIEEFSLSTSLPWQVIAVRLLFATGLGSVLGFEREIAERPAGLRTHMMIALAAAVFAVIALEIIAMPAFSDDQIRTDPLRLVEAITAGVAFLAAGSILMRRGKVQGLTTGAGMWLAGACGLSAGLGLWPVALLSCLLGGLVLALVRRLETRVMPKPAKKPAKHSVKQSGGSGDDG
jgi:putative Mg2+ transporter-C (MgtC) family protein